MTAVRLKFEHEKSIWASQVMAEARDVVAKRKADGDDYAQYQLQQRHLEDLLLQQQQQEQQQLHQYSGDGLEQDTTPASSTTNPYPSKRRKFSTPQKTQNDETN